MRVYGALMWSLGKVIKTPEVSRVYIGSFWDQPYLFDEQRKLFEAEQEDLFKDLIDIPRQAATRKLNDLIRRCRTVKVLYYSYYYHYYITILLPINNRNKTIFLCRPKEEN